MRTCEAILIYSSFRYSNPRLFGFVVRSQQLEEPAGFHFTPAAICHLAWPAQSECNRVNRQDKTRQVQQRGQLLQLLLLLRRGLDLAPSADPGEKMTILLLL